MSENQDVLSPTWLDPDTPRTILVKQPCQCRGECPYVGTHRYRFEGPWMHATYHELKFHEDDYHNR